MGHVTRICEEYQRDSMQSGLARGKAEEGSEANQTRPELARTCHDEARASGLGNQQTQINLDKWICDWIREDCCFEENRTRERNLTRYKLDVNWIREEHQRYRMHSGLARGKSEEGCEAKKTRP